VGDTRTETAGGVIVTVAEAERLGSDWLVAVTVAVLEVGAPAGAVYSPAVDMLPAVALQVTAVLLRPTTFAIKGTLRFVSTVVAVGAIVTACPTPCPLNCTVCGLPDALSVTVKVALSPVVVDGLKVTLIVHIAPALSTPALPGQLLN
jgi:hypothetical protein